MLVGIFKIILLFWLKNYARMGIVFIKVCITTPAAGSVNTKIGAPVQRSPDFK